MIHILSREKTAEGSDGMDGTSGMGDADGLGKRCRLKPAFQCSLHAGGWAKPGSRREACSTVARASGQVGGGGVIGVAPEDSGKEFPGAGTLAQAEPGLGLQK